MANLTANTKNCGQITLNTKPHSDPRRNSRQGILQNLEENDNILADTLEDDKNLKGKLIKRRKTVKNSSDSQTFPEVELETISSHEGQVETELTKALLLLEPESITPRQALEIIYDLHAKAQSKR